VEEGIADLEFGCHAIVEQLYVALADVDAVGRTVAALVADRGKTP
jgi:hypothetical protein